MPVPIQNPPMFRLSVFSIALLSLTAGPVWQTPAAPALSADTLIARHIAARGGLDRLRAITSLRITRQMGTPFATVPVVLLRARPDRLRIETSPPGRPTTARLITGDGAWDETPQGWTARPDAAAAELREIDGDFDGFVVDYAAKGHHADYLGLETVSGQPAHHLKFTLKSGAERHVYLDPVTLLERRHRGLYLLPNNKPVAITLDFSDWRKVAGVMFPFAIDEDRDAPGQTYAIYVDRIEVNVPIDPARFTPPAK